MNQSRLPATLFADFVCPASYLLETALRRRSTDDLDLRYRAVELFPAPDGYGAQTGTAQWDALRAIASELEIVLTDPGFAPRTRKAHEASRWARDRGVEREIRAGIYDAYWSRGLDIERIDVLMSLADASGVEAEELKIALDLDQHREEVLRDEEIARRLRVPGTPVLFVGTGKNAAVLAGAFAQAELESAIRAAIDQTRRPDHV